MQASINVLVNTVKFGNAMEAAGTTKRKKKEGEILLRPIICICNDL